MFVNIYKQSPNNAYERSSFEGLNQHYNSLKRVPSNESSNNYPFEQVDHTVKPEMPISRFSGGGGGRSSSSSSNRALLYDPISALPVPNHPNLTDNWRKYEEDPFLAKVPTFAQNISNQLSSSAPNKYSSSSSTSVPFSQSSSLSTKSPKLIFSSDYTLYDTQLKLSTEQSVNNHHHNNTDLLRKSSSLGHIPDDMISDQSFLNSEYKNLMNNTHSLPMPISGGSFQNRPTKLVPEVNNPQRLTVESMDSTISNPFSSSNSDNEYSVCSVSTNSSVNSAHRNSIGEQFLSSETVYTNKTPNKETPLIHVDNFENNHIQDAPKFKLRKAKSATLLNDDEDNKSSSNSRINSKDSLLSQDTLETFDMAPGDLSYRQELTRKGTTNKHFNPNQRPQHFHRHSIVTYVPNSLHGENFNIPNNISYQNVIKAAPENQFRSDQSNSNSLQHDPHTEIHSPLFPMDDDSDNGNNNNNTNTENNNNNNNNQFTQENSENGDNGDDQNLSGTLKYSDTF